MNPRISSCHVFIWRYKSSKELSEGCNSAISGFPLLRDSRRVISCCTYACTHPYTCMHTHRTENKKTQFQKTQVWHSIKQKVQSLKMLNPVLTDFVLIPLWKQTCELCATFLRHIFFCYFITLTQNCLIKVPITISCTTKLWYVKLQTRKHWNHKFLQY